MKSYVATYNSGVTGGLKKPETDQDTEKNVSEINNRLEENWKKIEISNVLEGIRIENRQAAIGTLCVSGAEESIQRLKEFLHNNNLGTVIEDKVMFRAC